MTQNEQKWGDEGFAVTKPAKIAEKWKDDIKFCKVCVMFVIDVFATTTKILTGCKSAQNLVTLPEKIFNL